MNTESKQKALNLFQASLTAAQLAGNPDGFLGMDMDDEKGDKYRYWRDDIDRVWQQKFVVDENGYEKSQGPKQVIGLIENGILKEIDYDRKERGAGMQKRQTLGIYVTPDEYKKIAHEAARNGVSVSRYVKNIVLDHINHQ